MLRMKRHAPTSKKSERAICETTKALDRKALWIPADEFPESSYSTSTGAMLEERSAGKIPKITLARTERASVMKSTMWSTRMFSATGRLVGGTKLEKVPAVQVVIKMAMPPPTRESKRLSA